jgi:transcriptional regulator with XRE-family HTH domain
VIRLTLGRRLSKLREKRGLDQAQLGEKLNLSKSTISAYERETRSPNPEIIVLLAEFFDTTTDFLLRGDIRTQNEIVDEEVAYFMEEINKLGEREQIYLKGKIEDMIKTLSKL